MSRQCLSQPVMAWMTAPTSQHSSQAQCAAPAKRGALGRRPPLLSRHGSWSPVALSLPFAGWLRSARQAPVMLMCCRSEAMGGAGGGGSRGGSGRGGGSGGRGDSSSRGHQGWQRGFLLFLLLVAIPSCLGVLLDVLPGLLPESTEERRRRQQLSAAAPSWRVSIIVPTLNEERGILQTLSYLEQQLQLPAAEIIVADGGSSDSTLALVAKHHKRVRVVRSRRGRGRQMNAGAAAATGDVLVFCHADSRPAPDTVAAVRAALSDPRVVLGGFRTTIECFPEDSQHGTDAAAAAAAAAAEAAGSAATSGASAGGCKSAGQGRVLRFMTGHHWAKTFYGPLLLRPLSYARGLRCLFGDQTLFCKTSDFRRAGGYSEQLPIMEDADLCIRMHEMGPDGLPGRGRILHLHSPLNRTSGRRLAAWGNVRGTFIHAVIGLSWYMGADAARLHALYQQLYTDHYR